MVNATCRRASEGGQAFIVWENGWFNIQQNERYSWLQVPVRNNETGMGTKNTSKALTPRHYGETPEHCPLTMFLLRFCGVWRSRQNGWVDQIIGRQGILADELTELHLLKDKFVRDGCLPSPKRRKETTKVDWG